MATEELSVKVDAAVADFNASMERVEDKLEEVADESNSTSRSFGRLSASAGGATASLGTMSAVTTATLIPSLLTLSTVLAPLTVVLGGIAAAGASLAAVFGGLAATGVVTHMDELKTAVANARQEIIQIIQPLGEVFGPLLVDAVQALPNLVQAIVDSLGPLDQFRNSLVQMGRIATRIIPQVTAAMFDLAESALPVLNQALTALEAQGPGVFNTLQNREIFPLTVQLASAFADLAPAVLEFGTTTANLVLPAVTSLADGLGSVIERVNQLTPDMRRLVIATTALSPLLTTVGSILAGLSAPVLAVVAALGALGVAYQQNLGGFADSVNSLLPSVEELQSIGESAFEALTNTLIGFGSAASPALQTVEQGVISLQAPLMELGRAGRRVFRGLSNFLRRTVAPAFRFALGQIVLPILSRVIGVLGRQLGPVIREVSQTITALTGAARVVGGVFQTVWQTIDGVVTPIVSGLADAIGVVLGTALNNIIESFKLILNLIQGDFGAALKNLDTIVQNSFSAAFDLVGIAQDGFNALVTYLEEDAVSDIKTALKTFGSGIETALKGAIDLAGMFGGLLIDLGEYLTTDAMGDIVSGGKKAITIFGSAFETAFEGAVDLVSALGNVMVEVGSYLVNDAVPDIASDIATVGAKMANAIIDALNEAIPNDIGFNVGKIKVAGQTVWGGGEVGVDLPNNPVPSAQTGGFIDEGGLLNVHAGERVVPAAQVSDRGPMDMNSNVTVENTVVVDVDDRQLREIMAAEAETVVENKERRSKRNTGGSQRI